MSVLTQRRGIIVMSTLLVAAGAGAAIAVQASASDGSATSKHTAAPLPTPVMPAGVHRVARPFAAATNAHCGQTITASLTLNGDLDCSSSPVTTILTIAGTSAVTLNLNGHYIFGTQSGGNQTGVVVNGTSDIVENGYIEAVHTGVQVNGNKVTITKDVISNNYDGIVDAGATTKITNNSVARNGDVGIYAVGTGATYSGNKIATNGYGIVVFGAGQIISGNELDSNDGYGMYLDGQKVTIAGNSANYNGFYGIDDIAQFELTDGGGNTAHGNGSATNPQQCLGITCS